MAKRRDLKECFFVCSEGADPYSILLVDPQTGGSRWSFRGTELQGNKIQTAELIGHQQTHLCVTLADKPIIYTIPLRQQKSANVPFSTKSILNEKANFLKSHPSGDFIFVASGNKLITWALRSGQMLSMVEEHIRGISALVVSSCGNFLATGSKDGAIKIFMTANLISLPDELARISPIVNYSAHSLEVSDLHISPGLNIRILSVSSDHSACLYSMATQQVLLRLTTDQPLTSCCMDPAETRIFLASSSGRIIAVDIQSEFVSAFHQMKGGATNGHSSVNQQFGHQHESAIRKLSINMDASRLVSGDQNGLYCIWDMANGECLRSGKMPGPISELSFSFINNSWLKQEVGTTQLPPHSVQLPLISSLQKEISNVRKLKAIKHSNGSDEEILNEKELQNYFDKMLKDLNGQILRGEAKKVQTGGVLNNDYNEINGRKRYRLESPSAEKQTSLQSDPTSSTSKSTETSLGIDELRMKVTELEREIARIVIVNNDLYNFAAGLTLDEENII